MSEQTLTSAAATRGPLAMEAISLSKDFRIGRGHTLHAVRDVSFNLYRGAVVALVGESGSGKSTAARLLAGQERLTSGTIRLDGKQVEVSSRGDFRRYKSEVQLVFQDPFSSLNPIHTVRYHLERPVKLHQGKDAKVGQEVVSLMEQVRLTPAKQFLAKYPHELSGGQRQRVSFARALAARPSVLLADEPVSMLDVSIRLEMLNLLNDLTHLIRDHGKRRLFWVDGPPNSPDSGERRLGLEQVLRANPQCELVGWHQGFFSVQSGEEAGERLVAMPRQALPDAVVSANDQMAIGVLKALTRAGITVPDEVALVGFDDIFPGSLCEPPLTTVHQPMRMLGERACVRLLDRIANPGLSPTVELLPTELVLRSSCGCPPGTVTRQPVETLKAARIRPAGVQTGGRGTRQGGPKASRPARQAAKA